MNELGLPTSFGTQKKKISKHNGHARNKEQQRFSDQVDFDVEEAFNKRFTFFDKKKFQKKNICKLPYPGLLFRDDKWKVESFYELKTKLNNIKSKLNNLNLKEWHLHTTNTNIAGDVMKKLRYEIAPEFLTQAWCKMYECLMSFWLVPKIDNTGWFNSVHLCEAPGAFITALHHFLQTYYPDVRWDWLATTLNPYHEGNPLSHMIQDDRFILHTLPHWTFGADATGDLMDKQNYIHLQHQVQTRLWGNVLLVTADGSIDCQNNPSEQETLVAPLHYCETLTALSILQRGGSFILKMFTLFECESICLLYLLNCAFEHVSVFKPVKSKEGNSEVYVLCSFYKGKGYLKPWMLALYNKFGPTNSKAMFSKSHIPEEFMAEMYQCARKFTCLQSQVIERNLDLFNFPTEQKLFNLKIAKKKVAFRYLQQYDLRPVEKVLVGNDVLAQTPTFNLAQKYEEGTFNDRLQKSLLDKPEAVKELLDGLKDVGCQWPFSSTVSWFMLNQSRLPSLEFTYGESVSNVRSSKFCNGRILEAYNKVPSACLIKSDKSNVPISTTIDAGQFPWEECSSYCNKLLLDSLSQTLSELPRNNSLCILGLPLLTQFSVAVVFLLAHSFHQMGLTVDGNVILCGYQQALSPVDWIQEVLKTMKPFPTSQSMLSFVPINILCDKSYCSIEGVTFYMIVSSINNARLMLALESEMTRCQQQDIIEHQTEQRDSMIPSPPSL